MATEKSREILAFLNSNEEFAKKLGELQPEVAADELTKHGLRCSREDLLNLSEEMKKAVAESGELDEGALENVAGGSKFTFYLGVACGAAVVTVACCAPW